MCTMHFVCMVELHCAIYVRTVRVRVRDTVYTYHLYCKPCYQATGDAFNFVYCVCRSILTQPWMEIGGKMNVSCEQTGCHAVVEFHCKVTQGSLHCMHILLNPPMVLPILAAYLRWEEAPGDRRAVVSVLPSPLHVYTTLCSEVNCTVRCPCIWCTSYLCMQWPL